jgi:hypothetical protein
MLTIDRDRALEQYRRSLARAYDAMCLATPEIEASMCERDQKILNRTIWSLKQLLIAVGSL